MRSYPPEDEKGLTTPFGMLRFAHEYQQAAILVHKEGTLATPAYFLLGQSIELSLKAYLLVRGIPLETLRFKPFGHDLGTLWKEAKRLRIDRLVSMPFEGIADDVISTLNQHYSTHEFRYIKTGSNTVPTWGFAEVVARQLTKGLHDLCLRRRVGKENALKRIALKGKF